MPIVHFGYWTQTLEKWCERGHLSKDEIQDVTDGNEKERAISQKLGFDFNWFTVVRDGSDVLSSLFPVFEEEVLESSPDGSRHVSNTYGVVELVRPGAVSIPSEIDHLLKDRRSWEELFKPRLQYSEERFDEVVLASIAAGDSTREDPLGLFSGSLFGQIRNMLGIQEVSYLYVDDPELYEEIIDTVGQLCYQVTARLLASGISFDFGHFWEDICFKGGPLVSPAVFAEKVGPHYKRITDLMRRHGIDIVSVDCDGKVDALVPIWLENGVNTMFPIEVGTWGASIKPWREQFGRQLRGVGGMNKSVLAEDRAAIDREVERMKALADLGGFIPCPDHRLPPTAEWDNVRYYCDSMRRAFG
jgi:uroporphyrinogen decarboxylase